DLIHTEAGVGPVKAGGRNSAQHVAPDSLLSVSGRSVPPGVGAVDLHGVDWPDLARLDNALSDLLRLDPVCVSNLMVVLGHVDKRVQFRVVDRGGMLTAEEIVVIPHLGQLNLNAGLGSPLLDVIGPVCAPL